MKTQRRGSSAKPRDPVEAYARAVLAGQIVANRLVRLAAERHLRDLAEGPARGLQWDWLAAEDVIAFFSNALRLAEGEFAGRPFVLTPWEQFVVGSLFGWNGPDGYRRFRTAYCEIGKGNGKSPLAAGIGLYGLIADQEASAEIYSAATNRDQAKIVWRDAARMVAASPVLKGQIVERVNNLSYKGQSYFRPVSSDASSLDGFRPHIVIVDEIHEHPNSLVIDKMRAGFKGRRQPLLIEITNSGFDKLSVCYQHHEFSIKVLEGTVENDAWFAFVCGLDEGDDWRDEAVWPKANPNLGVSVTLKYLREQVAEAVEMPAKQSIVRRLNFCAWTEGAVRAIDMDQWNRGGPSSSTPAALVEAGIDEMAASLRGRECRGGLDLGRVGDLSAFVLLFRPIEPGEPWKILCRFWCPNDDIEIRSRRDRAPYSVWRDQRFLIATDGNVTDFKFIGAEVVRIARLFDIREIGFDRTFAGELIQTLMDENLNMVEVGQGFLTMAAPTAELLRLVKGGELWHGAHPIMRWCASNLSVRQDPAGNLKPDKERSSEKIDGIAALCNALAVTLVAESDRIYSDGRGLLVLGG
jgi:phage terminase large subunit-like protein